MFMDEELILPSFSPLVGVLGADEIYKYKN